MGKTDRPSEQTCDPTLPEPNYAAMVELAEMINKKKANRWVLAIILRGSSAGLPVTLDMKLIYQCTRGHTQSTGPHQLPESQSIPSRTLDPRSPG